ncbi:E3 ubiquitin-protein ligase TTC3-like [Protopterus annectens]|uniref:E3 ubiquitin-protein ligase TTC3-like n=1 Tax=Protopterus annectens TaxID=7888 RepID=UPI001CF98A18|nr:E3 ubiquitin-protein ligase TTC3-like [Protopterus annectens]
MDWLRSIGDFTTLQKLTKLGKDRTTVINIFFAEFGLYVEKTVSESRDLIEDRFQHCEYCIKISEDMKKKGNAEFSRQNYEAAIKWYSKAIEFWPENHLLYGNRALCYLRVQHYRRALGDGKRAIVLKPHWSKGHYRFCHALFMMGECKRAVEANEKAIELCKDDTEGIQDLLSQKTSFKEQLEEKANGKKKKLKKEPHSKRMCIEHLNDENVYEKAAHTSYNHALKEYDELLEKGVRFVDDLIFLVEGGETLVDNFILDLNKNMFSLEFDGLKKGTSIPFLDIILNIVDENVLECKVYVGNFRNVPFHSSEGVNEVKEENVRHTIHLTSLILVKLSPMSSVKPRQIK